MYPHTWIGQEKQKVGRTHSLSMCLGLCPLGLQLYGFRVQSYGFRRVPFFFLLIIRPTVRYTAEQTVRRCSVARHGTVSRRASRTTVSLAAHIPDPTTPNGPRLPCGQQHPAASTAMRSR
eukprot:1383623-Prymnesium_polylepis.2